MKKIEEQKEMIAASVLSPEVDKLIEQKLGIVTQVREVQNMAVIVNQKVDKEEFVTDASDSLVKRSQRRLVVSEAAVG